MWRLYLVICKINLTSSCVSRCNLMILIRTESNAKQHSEHLWSKETHSDILYIYTVCVYIYLWFSALQKPNELYFWETGQQLSKWMSQLSGQVFLHLKDKDNIQVEILLKEVNHLWKRGPLIVSCWLLLTISHQIKPVQPLQGLCTKRINASMLESLYHHKRWGHLNESWNVLSSKETPRTFRSCFLDRD